MDLNIPYYFTLSDEDQHDMIVQTLYAQERDLHAHILNQHRYTHMLKELSPGPFADRIAQLLEETTARIAEVQCILTHTRSQLPADTNAIQAALVRMRGTAS